MPGLTWWRRNRREQELNRELQDHLEFEAAEQLENGLAPEEASRAARRALGNLGPIAEDTRQAWGGATMEKLARDFRYALRMMRRSPAFTTAAVLTLALGIGGNTAMFTVVNTILLKPLPYRDSEGLVAIFATQRGMSQMPFSAPDFLDYRAEARTLAEMFAYNPFSFNVTAVPNAERVTGVQASANFFDVLGGRPLHGRTFTSGEDQPGAEAVAVLSYGLWQRQFAGDPGAIGRTIRLNGQQSTIIGVMPPDFLFPYGRNVDLWVPLVLEPSQRANRGLRFLFLVGRLGTGQSMDRALVEMQAIAERLAHEFPQTNRSLGLRLLLLHEQVVGRSRPALMILLGAIGLVLLIACANVASLLLARANARQKELAVRKALGASVAGLMRQLMTESLVLSTLAGLFGTLLAYAAVRALRSTLPAGIPLVAELRIDGGVLIFTMAASILTGLLFGVVPALQMSRSPSGGLWQGAGRSFGGRGSGLAARVFVTAQVALALVLTIGSGLLVESFLRLERVALGMNPAGLIAFSVWPSEKAYVEPASKAAYYAQVLERVSVLPGVQTSGAIAYPPLGGGCANGSVTILERPAELGQVHSDFNVASPGFFHAIGTPVRMGREFSDQDEASSEPVTVISDSFARMVFPGENPMGKRVAFWGRTRTIVGIVGDIRQTAAQEPLPTLYVPSAQNPWPYMTILLRTGAGNGMAGSLRQAVRAVDPDQPIFHLQFIAETKAEGLAQPRFEMVLLGTFAGMALLLASIGIYGLMAYWVAQRTPEIGIRMALGAERMAVLRLVLRQGFTLTLCGVAAGILSALALSRVLTSLLFGVTATDPATFAGTSLLLMAVATVAIWLPARRATRIDPLVALRWE